MSSIDQQFIEYIVKSLVGNPDAVSIERRIDEKGVLLELTVDPEDLGRVIGKRGGTAQSLRTLLRALGTKNEARYNLKIIDNGEPRPQRENYDSDSVSVVSERASDDANFSEPQPSNTNNDDSNNVESEESEDQNSAANKTRRELADLDDLDV